MFLRAILKGMALSATLVAPACALIVGPLDANGVGGSTGTNASTGAGGLRGTGVSTASGSSTAAGSCSSPNAGCPPVRSLYSEPMTPSLTGMVLVGKDLYFGTATNETVMRVSTDGSGVQSLAVSPFRTSLLATDGASYVFWADDDAPRIERMGLDGGGQFAVVDWSPLNPGDALPTAMVVSGGYLYWVMTSPPSVFRAPTDGSLQQGFWDAGTIASAPASMPFSVAVDSQDVYWSDGTKILRTSLASIGSSDAGAPEVWVTEDRYPLLLAIDQDRLYWSIISNGTVQSKPKDAGSGLTPLTYATLQSPIALYVDSTFIYWLNQDGSLWAATKAAPSPPVQIACASPAGTAGLGNAIASDDSAVYWTTSGQNNCSAGLFQAPKPAH
jgi:hypothetical protein